METMLKGRSDLLAWEAYKPANFFEADRNLQAVLRRYLGADYESYAPTFAALGAQAATTLDQAAKLEDRIGNHPRLERWSGLGERIEQIEFHPDHDRAGQIIWQSGILALQAQPATSVAQMALFYLLGHNGEAGHLCSITCTSGLIRALQQRADAPIRERFLPPLLDPDYERMQHGAQFLTEVQGGSDVGANLVTAQPAADGSWRINGEKWFCSNINADQFLLTARASDASGTRGLGLFLIPRLLQDGSTNGFFLRRLKDKLGTRTLASAELDFVEAVAYPIGAIEHGFKTVVELVLNTSRLMNAVACAGVMRRAYLEAASYACHRQAFGSAIAHYPLVQEAVADLLTEACAATASSFYLAALLDRIESGQGSTDDEAIYRLLVNVNKYITSIRGTEMVHRAIEVFGGNGAIESFSILPRLYRDMVVLESWEGTHNVLCLQVLRDIQRYNIHQPFLQMLHASLAHIQHPDLATGADLVRNGITRWGQMLTHMQQAGDQYAQAHARRLVDLAAMIAQGTLLLMEAQWEYDQNMPGYKTDVVTHFLNRYLHPGYDPMTDSTYLARIQRLMMVQGSS